MLYFSQLAIVEYLIPSPPLYSPPKICNIFHTTKFIFLAGYYNLGTTAYYNVPYKGQPIA